MVFYLLFPTRTFQVWGMSICWFITLSPQSTEHVDAQGTMYQTYGFVWNEGTPKSNSFENRILPINRVTPVEQTPFSDKSRYHTFGSTSKYFTIFIYIYIYLYGIHGSMGNWYHHFSSIHTATGHSSRESSAWASWSTWPKDLSGGVDELFIWGFHKWRYPKNGWFKM